MRFGMKATLEIQIHKSQLFGEMRLTMASSALVLSNSTRNADKWQAHSVCVFVLSCAVESC